MGLFPHLLIHFSLSIFSGLAIGIWQGDFLTAIVFAVLGGFLIDVDHLFDYFLAFGFKFKPKWFGEGRQFLKSDKIFVLFHGWEYVIILIVMSFFISGEFKIGVMAFALSLFVHLIADCFINNGVKPVSYFISYKILNGFEIRKLVTEDHWKKHQRQKERTITLK